MSLTVSDLVNKYEGEQKAKCKIIFDENSSGLRQVVKASMGNRGFYEEISDVHKQCHSVLGVPEQPDIKTLCWLCGFEINCLNNINGQTINGITVIVPAKAAMLDKATCEHVLPIKLASTVGALYQERAHFSGNDYKLPPNIFCKLRHAEYEYSHNLCNYAKNDLYFLTWPRESDGKDLCSLYTNEAKINCFLQKLLNYREEGKVRSSFITLNIEGGLFPSQPNPFQIQVDNLVVAKLILDAVRQGIDWFASDAHKHQVMLNWVSDRFEMIKHKMTTVSEIIRIADGCYTNERGVWAKLIDLKVKKGYRVTNQLESIDCVPKKGLHQVAMETYSPYGPVGQVLPALQGMLGLGQLGQTSQDMERRLALEDIDEIGKIANTLKQVPALIGLQVPADPNLVAQQIYQSQSLRQLIAQHGNFVGFQNDPSGVEYAFFQNGHHVRRSYIYDDTSASGGGLRRKHTQSRKAHKRKHRRSTRK